MPEVSLTLVEANARTQLIFSTPGRGVRRVIIEVDALDAVIDVEITQGPPFPSSFPQSYQKRRRDDVWEQAGGPHLKVKQKEEITMRCILVRIGRFLGRIDSETGFRAR